jgi:hypothetical protein
MGRQLATMDRETLFHPGGCSQAPSPAETDVAEP